MRAPQYQYARERYQRTVAYHPWPCANQLIPEEFPCYLHPKTTRKNKKEVYVSYEHEGCKMRGGRILHDTKRKKHALKALQAVSRDSKVAVCWYGQCCNMHITTGPLIISASGPSTPDSVQRGVSNSPVFLVSNAVSYNDVSKNQAKHLISRLFVILGQHYSEDRAFAWVLRLVFMHDHSVLYSDTAWVLLYAAPTLLGLISYLS